MAVQMNDPAAQRWHLDRRIPLALIVAIIMQTFGFGWWMSAITGRIDTLEKTAIKQEVAYERLIRIDEQVSNIRELLRKGNAP